MSTVSTICRKPAILLAVASTLAVAAAANAANLPFNKIVVFGDSLSDVGNTYAASGGTDPSPPPAYTAGEYTDGPDTTPSTSIVGVWVQQLNNNFLGFTPLAPSLTGGTDYAFGSAVTGLSSPVPGMANQVNTFLQANTTAPSNALYVLWGGANDVIAAATASGATLTSIDAASTAAATNIDTQIQQLYNAGARNFMWLNMPPLDATPGVMAQGLLAEYAANSATNTFNTAWQADLAALRSANPGMTLLGEDINTLTNNFISNSTAYGFTNVTTPAQGLTGINPDTYLFWDAIHPTTAADKYLAQQAYTDITTTFVPEPSAMLLLATGAACCLLPRRRQRRLARA